MQCGESANPCDGKGKSAEKYALSFRIKSSLALRPDDRKRGARKNADGIHLKAVEFQNSDRQAIYEALLLYGNRQGKPHERHKNRRPCGGAYIIGYNIRRRLSRGHRGTGEALQDFSAGCLLAATKAEAPVVVGTIWGTEKIHRNFPWHRTDVYFDIIDVIYPEKQRTAVLAERIKNEMEAQINERKKEEKK